MLHINNAKCKALPLYTTAIIVTHLTYNVITTTMDQVYG
jgi:hypothetical protein